MSNMTMEEATLKLRKWKFALFFALMSCSVAYVGYAFYTLTYSPKPSDVLINKLGGVYVSEDMTKSNVSEGEVKQFAQDSIYNSFKLHYATFRPREEYEQLIAGELTSDIPDHRDKIEMLFKKEAWVKFVAELEAAPWMKNFHYERRKLFVAFTVPPQKTTFSRNRDDERMPGSVMSDDGRLNITYKGHMFVVSRSKGVREENYRVDYTVTLERKPLVIEKRTNDYFFKPMAISNTFEWQIKSLEWSAARRT
ncbi:MAG: hypothetical protein GY774_01135 [Planctomycetes bacterium]|nr:hypothetical protein [Planctomycetota bacterium]|tara:strand:+ start:17061 stop:17816 length:756 start_codon:yes stop_codon:yes gene_type:complete